MTLFRWSEDKNRALQEQRGIGFAQVVVAIEAGGLLDDYPHPNSSEYPRQSVMVVEYMNYAHLVPYVIEDQGDIFLKTIIPSRKATRDYLIDSDNEEDIHHE